MLVDAPLDIDAPTARPLTGDVLRLGVSID
jgi:hypothetical protein